MAFSREDVEALSASLIEPTWMLERRLESWGWFEKMELPIETGENEHWRHTDLRRLKFKPDAFTTTMPSLDAEMPPADKGLLENQGDRAGHVVQLGGDTVFTSLNDDVAAKGVILLDLDSAVKQHPDLVQKHLFSVLRPDESYFAALHGALVLGGTFLYVPKGVTVELPIESRRVLNAPGSALFPHTLIVVEEGAEVSYLERLGSGPTAGMALSVGSIEVVAADSARVTVASLQEYGPDVWHFQRQRATLGEKVAYRNMVLTLGGRLSREEVETSMRGSHTSVDMLGLYFASQNQHFDFRTRQDHFGTNCFSDLLYKGALTDTSRAVYAGMIRVAPGAAQTDAYQTNRNLVLSDRAKADSKPELEIENNDVKCSHAASVGQLNKEEIYYLLTRGLPMEEAERLIVNGFFEEVVGRIKSPEIRTLLSDAVQRKISQRGEAA